MAAAHLFFSFNYVFPVATQVKHGVRANWSQQSEKVSACIQELVEVILHTLTLEELAA